MNPGGLAHSLDSWALYHRPRTSVPPQEFCAGRALRDRTPPSSRRTTVGRGHPHASYSPGCQALGLRPTQGSPSQAHLSSSSNSSRTVMAATTVMA